MALNNQDLFLVSQHQSGTGTYEDKKIKYSKLKDELGARLAQREKTNPVTGELILTPGYMYPDFSLGYDEQTGKLFLPLDARGVNFAGVINSDNEPDLPVGDENPGDFYICTEADLEISTLKWKGVSVDAEAIVVDPTNQVLVSGGSGYAINNYTITTADLKSTNKNKIIVGLIDLEIVNGEVISATHELSGLDIPSLNLVGGIFEFGDTSGFSYDEPALGEVISVVTIGDQHKINFKIINQGRGYRVFSESGVLTGAFAIPSTEVSPKKFEVDVNVNALGNVTGIAAVRIESGFTNGDVLAIQLPFGSGVPSTPATFELEYENEGTRTIQINDKLILQQNKEWTVLIDALAEQAVLAITNEEGDPDNTGTDVNLTPALHIDQLNEGDTRYLTMKIDNVDSDNPGLMPPDLFDQITSYPELVAGGTVIDVNVASMVSVDQDAGGNIIDMVEINPLISTDDPIDGIDSSVAKNVILDIKLVGEHATGVRTPGIVYVANDSELLDQIKNFTAESGEADRVVNINKAGTHLMPRNIEHLDDRTEDYKTAKRVNLTAEDHYVDGNDQTSFLDIISTLTYEDGGNATAEATYSYEWSGIEYPNKPSKIVGGDTPTLRVTGLDFTGPTEITCVVTETVGDDEVFQTLTDTIYIDFLSDGTPVIGDIQILGPDPVYLGDTEKYTVSITNGTSTDNVVTGTADPDYADQADNLLTFTQLGGCRLDATVTSASSDPSTQSTSRIITVIEKPVDPPVLGDLTIVGPSSVEVDNVTPYEYNYTGTAHEISHTWSIASGDETKHTIDEDGNLTSTEVGTVTIQVDLETSLGSLVATKEINVVEVPSGNENWDGDPEEKFRLHIIIEANGKWTFGPIDRGFKVYNMANGNLINTSTNPGAGAQVSIGQEYMVIVTKTNESIELIGKTVTTNSPPAMSLGALTSTATHDGDYRKLFRDTRLTDLTHMDLSNATDISQMFDRCSFELGCSFDFTGAKITKAYRTFANNNTSFSRRVRPEWGFDTMDMSECTTIEEIFLESHVDRVKDSGSYPGVGHLNHVKLNWDLSSCTNFKGALQKTRGSFDYDARAEFMFGRATPPTVNKGDNFINFAKDAYKFSQNLSDWCVSGVEDGPNTAGAFQGTGRASNLNPKWGTCPGYSFR